MTLNRIVDISQNIPQRHVETRNGNDFNVAGNSQTEDEAEALALRPWMMILGLVITTQLLVVFARVLTM